MRINVVIKEKKEGIDVGMATVTIPTQHNINRNSGAILLRVSKPDLTQEKEILLSIGDFSLSYEEGFLYLNGQSGQLNLATALFPGQSEILWTWIENNHRLVVKKDDETLLDSARHESGGIGGQFGPVITLSNTPKFTGAYKEVITYTKDFLYGEASQYGLARFMATGEVLFQADFSEAKHYKTNPMIETTFAPTDGSPILVRDDKGLLKRQYFFNRDTGEYTDTHTEEFIYKGEDKLALAYGGLNPRFKTIVSFENTDTFVVGYDKKPGDKIRIVEDALLFDFSEEEINQYYDQKLSITYQLERSYNVEYNDDTAHDSLRIQLNDHQDMPLEVIQEGNRFSDSKLGREIDLNPLVNPRHTGFMYIDKEKQETQAFRLSVSNPFVLADGLDTADFIVEAIDIEGNEVLSPYIDVFLMTEKGQQTDAYGSLHPVINFDTMKARNMAGRCYYQYQSPVITQDDYPLTQRIFVVAVDRLNGIGTQVPLYIRPVPSQLNSTGRKRSVPESAGIVFEYVARLFERELPAGHPLEALDRDQDGVLSRQDFLYFEAEKYNHALMQEIHAGLKELEA